MSNTDIADIIRESNTKRIRCRCYNPFQDGRYGAGIRVHNKKIPTATNPTNWRCAVCTMEKRI